MFLQTKYYFLRPSGIAGLLLSLTFFFSCKNKEVASVLFTSLDQTETGLHFINKLTPTPSFNMFKYMYFYNGAGVGAADFNKDGKIDLFFASNQGQNSLYLNQGNLQFKDVTKQAGIPDDHGWSTGVSVVDINDDGLLDIYVCRVGNYETLQSRNQLLICKGFTSDSIPLFADEAKAYHLDFSGFSTQAAFLDYDADGDLDMYLMNHSLRFNGTFAARKTYQNTYDSLAGDRFYRNDKGRFTDVTKEAGINSSIIGYGLGVVVSDINLDGLPDLYIGNDFHENDYLYINQGNGRFADSLEQEMMHTSQFSMGVDAADVDNDAYPEIISMDMLPSDPYILKRSLGEDAYEIFQFKIRHGYNYQYARNNLQWNRKNGTFSEVGLFAGVYATDWSWAPLWMDFDNDGKKDLFISNGIPKRLNDIDYVNFVSNEELQARIRNNELGDKDMTLVNKFPEIKLPNRFFRNAGNMQFENLNPSVSGDLPRFSNGAAYADLDNDGDLDIVVNNVDDAALIYRNDHTPLAPQDYMQLILQGNRGNQQAIGASLIVYAGKEVQTYEKYPVRGFQSSMEIPLQAGLKNVKADSILLVWPDHRYQRIDTLRGRRHLKYDSLLPYFDPKRLRTVPDTSALFSDITEGVALRWKHEENPFVEFDREPLIPKMVSREGPALAVADINGDGLEDVFVGSAKTYHPGVWLQNADGRFQKMKQPALEADSMFEEVDAEWVDINKDGFPDLLTASGGNEYFGHDRHLTSRIFLNDGRGNLKELNNAFPELYVNASVICAHDFTGDGVPDLFLGGRSVPWEYGETPSSYLLANDGKGHFTDVTAQYARELSSIGMVTAANWADINSDGKKDLVLSCEWGGIYAFEFKPQQFTKRVLTDRKGWWNSLTPVDIDGDGDLDWIAGNLGKNSRLTASKQKPVRLYYADFDGNEKKEQVLTYYLNDREIPFANKEELQKQLPGLKKKFLYAEDFAKATLSELLGKEKLNGAKVLTADYFPNSLLLNKGNGEYEVKELPMAAQLVPYRDAAVADLNRDSKPDLLLAGNFYENNIQMGRYDADPGTVLLNKGQAVLEPVLITGLRLRAQYRHIKPIHIRNKIAWILAANNDSLRVIKKP